MFLVQLFTKCAFDTSVFRPCGGARSTLTSRRAWVSVLMRLPFWGMVGCDQILAQMDAKIAAEAVLGKKGTAPRKVDNKPLDPVRAVSESFLELHGAGDSGVPAAGRTERASRGTGPADCWELFWVLFYALGSGNTVRLVVRKNRSGCHVCSHMRMCTRVHPCPHSLLTPNSPESCPVCFSPIQRNPEAACALAALAGRMLVARVPAPG